MKRDFGFIHPSKYNAISEWVLWDPGSTLLISSFHRSGDLIDPAEPAIDAAVFLTDRRGVLTRLEIRIVQSPEIPFTSVIDDRLTADPFVFVTSESETDSIIINDADLLEIVAFVRLDREDEAASTWN